MTVRSLCSFGHSCTKSVHLYNFTFLFVLSVEMTPKTKSGNGRRYKKENVDPSQGGRTVMVRSPWDCRKITVLYPCDYMGTAWAPCGNLAIAARGRTIISRAYNHRTIFFAEMTI